MNQDVLEEAVLRPSQRSALAELTTPPAPCAPPRRAPRADKNVRVAIVHDWLVTYAGAERVLEQIVACFPDADLFSVVDFLDDRSFLRGKPVTTSFIQKLPKARTKYRAYLPLMPIAIEQLDVSAYDVVISSSHAVAKGVLTGPDQVHISYVHSPIRYAWDLQHQYLQQSKLTNGPKSALARLILHYIRNWDIRTSNSVDTFVANSQFIARRIRKVYQRDAHVIFPPVDVDAFVLHEQKEDFYLTASRMVPYKKIDLIVEAFARMPQRRLVVIGDGPDMQKIRAKATPNVEIMGYQPFKVLQDKMQRAKAFVFAAEEDFGISVVEAQACGTPVIAYGKGGALETVRDLSSARPTGMFFDEQRAESIIAAVEEFDAHASRFVAADCRANAERFSAAHFRERFFAHVRAAVPALQGASLPAYEPYVAAPAASGDHAGATRAGDRSERRARRCRTVATRDCEGAACAHRSRAVRRWTISHGARYGRRERAGTRFRRAARSPQTGRHAAARPGAQGRCRAGARHRRTRAPCRCDLCEHAARDGDRRARGAACAAPGGVASARYRERRAFRPQATADHQMVREAWPRACDRQFGRVGARVCRADPFRRKAASTSFSTALQRRLSTRCATCRSRRCARA